jgi:hypothetical protein
MGRHKKGHRQRKKGEPTVSGPFVEVYGHLRRLVRKKRLFILFDGDPAAPRLTFFETTQGAEVLDYWPGSRLWAYPGRPWRGGRCDEHDDVIAVAVRLAGSLGAAGSRNSDLSQFGMPA